MQDELSHGCAGIGNLITSNGFFAEPVLVLVWQPRVRDQQALAAGRDGEDLSQLFAGSDQITREAESLAEIASLSRVPNIAPS